MLQRFLSRGKRQTRSTEISIKRACFALSVTVRWRWRLIKAPVVASMQTDARATPRRREENQCNAPQHNPCADVARGSMLKICWRCDDAMSPCGMAQKERSRRGVGRTRG